MTDDTMKRRGGLVTREDLAAYQAKVRKPLHLRYRGLDVFTMSPPSMGGIALYSIMMNLAQVKAHEAPAGSAIYFHGDVVHGSRKNETDQSRRALVLTYQPPGHPRWNREDVREVGPSERACVGARVPLLLLREERERAP